MNRSLTATLKYALSSDKKMELVATLVRGKKVQDAITILQYTPKKWAKILQKVIKSAYANAKNNAWIKDEEIYVEKIELWKWPNLKRMQFVWRSRIHWYHKYRTFVRVVLNTK